MVKSSYYSMQTIFNQVDGNNVGLHKLCRFTLRICLEIGQKVKSGRAKPYNAHISGIGKNMGLNFIGLVAALTTFFSIWAGHVLVRVIEYRSASIRLPAACFAAAGILLLIGTFLSTSLTASAVLGILSITALWDAYEFPRQQKRIIKGHAPANPSNPRHARILKEYKTATTLDLLKREPLGREVTQQESLDLVAAE
jgi:hypothetical protein